VKNDKTFQKTKKQKNFHKMMTKNKTNNFTFTLFDYINYNKTNIKVYSDDRLRKINYVSKPVSC
jgi:hypothetical protein